VLKRLKCLGMTPENQNCMQQKIKSRLNSGTAYYNLVQNLLPANCCLRIYILKYTELYFCLLFHESKTVLILGQGCRLCVFHPGVLSILITELQSYDLTLLTGVLDGKTTIQLLKARI